MADDVSQIDDPRYFVRVQVKEFGIPPIRDALVLGTKSPIGYNAIRKAVDLLAGPAFERIRVQDEVIGDIVVRAAILRRVPTDRLIAFVLRRIKPLMGEEDVLHLTLEAEIEMEESL